MREPLENCKSNFIFECLTIVCNIFGKLVRVFVYAFPIRLGIDALLNRQMKLLTEAGEPS